MKTLLIITAKVTMTVTATVTAMVVVTAMLMIPKMVMAQAGPGQHKTARPPIDTLKATVRVKVINYGDSLVVRWAPASSSLWIAANRSGYRLRRKVYARMEGKTLRLLDSSSFILHPWSLDQWGAYFNRTHDTSAATAAQVLYGKKMPLVPGKGTTALGSILDKYNEQQNRYAFALMVADGDPAAATGLGLRWVDKPVNGAFYYHYELIVLADNRYFKPDTGRALAIASQHYTKEKFPSIAAFAGDRKIKLVWDNLAAIGKYSAYFIEQSSDGRVWRRLNRVPFYPQNSALEVSKPVEYNDSLPVNYQKYYYRVRGINAFGDVSDPSDPIAVSGVDRTPPQYPVITAIKNPPGTKQIRLQWTKAQKEGDFRGFVVGRGTSLKGPFEPISPGFLPFGTKAFTDEHPRLDEPNYYIVAAVDTAGNSGRSMPAYMNVIDNDPPAVPQGLAGTIDSSGKVTLHWQWGMEPDLAGYKVFVSNAADSRFNCITPDLLTDTLFACPVNLHTLTRRIFFKIVAYDRSKNASKPSKVVALVRPDKLPPVGAAFRGFHVSDTAVLLRWLPGGSSDAAQQRLFRRTDSAASWTLLATFTPKDSIYADTTVRSKHFYSYAIETMDSSRLSSGRCFPLRVFVYVNVQKSRVTQFEATTDPDGKTCRLHWAPPSAAIDYYIVYREKGTEGMRLAANVPGTETGYTDNPGPGSWRYAIKAFYRAGGGSAVSESTPVDLRQKTQP